MRRFPNEEVQQVLANLRYRFPHATEADAITILENDERSDRADAQFEAREIADLNRDLDGMDA